MTCPECNSTITTDVEEGWTAHGPYGTHKVRHRYECECGHEGWWDVLRSYPDMDHCAELRHSCGAMQTVTVEQFRGHEPIRCACGFAGKVDLSDGIMNDTKGNEQSSQSSSAVAESCAQAEVNKLPDYMTICTAGTDCDWPGSFKNGIGWGKLIGHTYQWRQRHAKKCDGDLLQVPTVHVLKAAERREE